MDNHIIRIHHLKTDSGITTQGSIYPIARRPGQVKLPPGKLIWETFYSKSDIYGLLQDCSISSALTMEILQFCIKPLI